MSVCPGGIQKIHILSTKYAQNKEKINVVIILEKELSHGNKKKTVCNTVSKTKHLYFC